jgi:hypothetical protein
VGGERGGGPAGVSGPAAGLGRAEEKKKKRKKIGWARWAGKRVGLFVFFSFFQFLFFYFLFNLLLKTYSRILNKLLTTQSIKPMHST